MSIFASIQKSDDSSRSSDCVHSYFADVITSKLSQSEHTDFLNGMLIKLSEEAAKGSSCIVLSEDQRKTTIEALEVSPWLNSLLCLKGDRLQLKKYFQAEQDIEAALKTLALTCSESTQNKSDEAVLVSRLQQLEHMDDDGQRVILNALKSNLSIITGGPGTGKTTIVVRVLALLIESHRAAHDSLPTIEVLAPTGKAAARVKESVVSQKQAWLKDLRGFDRRIIEAIPEHSQTVQKFLAINPTTRKSRFKDSKTANVDIVIVDEASMLDVFLVQQLVTALKPTTRLIFLGDPYQLASVEAGNVLAQITHAGDHVHWLKPCCEKLIKSHRFTDDSGIGQLAYATNDGDVDRALDCLESDLKFDDVSIQKEVEQAREQAALGYNTYKQAISDYKGLVKKGAVSDEATKKVFEAFDQWQVFSPFRTGKFGVKGLNEYIENELKLSDGKDWYLGKPVMIQTNDHALKLYNGDIGICLDPNGETVTFPGTEASDSEDTSQAGYRHIPTRILPDNDLVYAMTVHKSQGSEYKACMLVVPEPNESQKNLLTREILYTAITRAKKEFRLFCREVELSLMVKTKTERVSGLFASES